MGRHARRVPAALLLVVTLPAGAADSPAPTEPRETGLVEAARSRLAQLDVTLVGEPAVLETITAADFVLKINGERIHAFELDRLCADPAGDPAPSLAPRPSYLLYFDQPMLTLEGRQRAIDTAVDLLPRLLEAGGRAMIVSNADTLEVVEPLNDSLPELLAALDRLEHDRKQWDPYAQLEDQRVGEVVRALNEDTQRAIALARVHQREERWRNEKSLRRLALAIGQIAESEPPRAVVYFADTLRENPGEHYMTFFGSALRARDLTLGVMETDILRGALPFDEVVNQASALGIRIYGVQAVGLGSHLDREGVSSAAMERTLAVPVSSHERIGAVHDTLRNLCGETGGDAFLNGVAAKRIAERIDADSACLFLLSFDPSGFAEDSPLRVKVQLRRDDVEVRVRGRLVVQSESARVTSRLLRAFVTAGTIEDPFVVRAALIPTGYDRGSYDALLQMKVDAVPLHGGVWELGASVVADDRVRAETAGRLTVDRPGVPVVLESELRLRPGEYDVVGVAHEARTGLVGSARLRVDWPRPEGVPATIAEIALLQPEPGAFLRGERSRIEGAVARGEGEPVDPARPLALVGLVCRGKSRAAGWRVERALVGASTVPFPPLELAFEEDRCAQLRDLVPPGTLGPGRYRFEVRVVHEGRTLAERWRELVVPGDGRDPAAAPAAGSD